MSPDDYLLYDATRPAKLPKINKFVPGESPEISPFSTITVYGKRKTGKSVFVKWHMQAFRHMIPWGWTFTKTKFNSFWATFMPERYILNEFNAGILQQIMDRQEQALTLYHEQPEDTDFNPRCFVNWDDYMGHDIRFNEKLHEYYYTGRHYATLNHYAAQHITQTPPAIRSNTDIAVLFSTDYHDSLDHYANDFGGRLHKKLFYELFFKVTNEKHHFLAIINDPNIDVEEKYYEGMAEVLDASPEYILGCEEFWAKDLDQYDTVCDGSMQKKLDRQSKLSEYQKPPQPIFENKKKKKNNSKIVVYNPDHFKDKSHLVNQHLPEIEN